MVTLPQNECPPYYNHYLKLIEEDILGQLKTQLQDFSVFLRAIPQEKYLYRYALEKWTVKEVVGHTVDTERVMAFRAFCIARGDKTPLPSFDENNYVANTNFNDRNMLDLIADFEVQRRATLSLFKSLSESELKRIGTASGKSASSRALFYFLLGHLQHHWDILKDRYL